MVLLALALGLLPGCERIDTTEARDDLPTEFFEGDVDLGEQGTPLGEDITWDDDLRLRVDAVGVDSDDRGPWLTVTYRVENTGFSRRPTLEEMIGRGVASRTTSPTRCSERPRPYWGAVST